MLNLLLLLFFVLGAGEQKAVLTWTLGPAERDALLAGEVIKRWSPANRVLIEIACTRSPEELLTARRAYHDRFKRSLEEDVAAHTSDHFRKVSASMLCAFFLFGKKKGLFCNLAKGHTKICDCSVTASLMKPSVLC